MKLQIPIQSSLALIRPMPQEWVGSAIRFAR